MCHHSLCVDGARHGVDHLERRLPDLPVVLASGYSHVLAQEGVHGLELLQKPYSADQVSRVLRRVLARGRREVPSSERSGTRPRA